MGCENFKDVRKIKDRIIILNQVIDINRKSDPFVMDAVREKDLLEIELNEIYLTQNKSIMKKVKI